LIWRSARTFDRALFALLAVIAAALAWRLYADYAAAPDLLWRDVYHDRNGHFSNGVALAVALAQFDIIAFVMELERARVWPPLHDLLVCISLLIGGIDYTRAIVADLIGWAATAVLAAMIAHRLFGDRLFEDRVAAWFAATVAFVFVVASPAFRLLGSDVMFEAPGAALSALAILSYLAAQAQPQRPGRWRVVALTLTALFFLKSNYWGLAAAALAVAAIVDAGFARVAPLLAPLRNIRIASLLRGILRDPLLWAFGLIVVLVGYLYARGPTAVALFGRNVSLYPPENLVTVAYVIMFIRIALAWRAHRGAIERFLGPPGCTLLYWHVAPVAVSWLLPKRLSAFLWYVGPANGNASFDPLDGVRSYWVAFAEGFHARPWLAPIVVALALIGLLGLRRLGPRAAVVFIFVAVCAAAVVIHPQHQGRFLGSWVFAVWVAAGLGAGVLLVGLFRGRPLVMRAAVALLVIVPLGAVNVWRPPSAIASAVAIRATSGPSDLDLVRPYISELDGLRRVAFVTTFGVTPLFGWVLRTRCGCEVEIETPWVAIPASRKDARRVTSARLETLRSDVLVLIDAPRGRYELRVLGLTYDRMVGVVDAMRDQNRFVLQSTHEIPSEGAVVTIWRRAALAPTPNR
jgi:hypothetical protein